MEAKQIIAARIHNSSLGKTVTVESIEAGQKLIKEWAEEQFGRELTHEENDGLENELEIYNDEDGDNIYTFAIGICE